MTDRRSRLGLVSAILFPALLGPSQLLLFGPFDTYRHNRSEFLASFWSIASVWVWGLAAVAAVLVAAGLMLGPSARRRYVALLFGIGLLLWAQGNLLVADYGPLYGERLDFSRHDWRTPWEIGLWVLVPALFAWFAGPVSTVAPLASQILLGLQAVVLVVSGAVGTSGAASEPAEWRAPHDRVYRLSEERNVILIVLDGFLSEVFGEIANEERDAFDRDLSGFTFFADHLGAFPTTRASMPAMLSGTQYRNERPFEEFWQEAQQQSIFTALYGAGYRINALTFHSKELPPRTLRSEVTRYSIPTPYGTREEYVRFAAAQLVDLTLFRHAPQALKPQVYNDESWLAQRWVAGPLSRAPAVRSERPSNHLLFLDDFTGQARTAGRSPVFLFLHLAVPHPPVVVDAGCGFTGRRTVNRQTYTAQARCALTVVRRFLQQLRSIGVYDRSLIVLTSDHGWNVARPDHPFGGLTGPAGPMDRVVLTAMPLLAVKPFDSAGPLRTSYAPTSISDLPATVLALAEIGKPPFPGASALALDPDAPRRRTYAYHSWSNADWQRPYLDLLHVFSVEGRVLDPAAWQFDRVIFDRSSDLGEQLKTRRAGLSSARRGEHGSFRQGGPHVVAYAPPDARAFEIRFARSPRATRPQSLTIRVDGREVARRHVADHAWHRVTVPLPARAPGDPPITIELSAAPPAFDEDGRHLGFRYAALEWTR